MKEYKIVENARQRAIDYHDGEPLSVGYRFFDEKAYESAKVWLTRNKMTFDDLGYGGEFNVIVTSVTKAALEYVFRHIEECEPHRICVVESRWVDVL